MSSIAQTRYNVEAPALPKMRRPSRGSGVSAAYVDEYNNRQVMPCKETRPRYNAAANGIPSSQKATVTALVEKAEHKIPLIEISAYLAKKYGRNIDRNRLCNEMYKIIRSNSEQEQWRFNQTSGRSKILCLADLVVEEWLEPARYWRENGNPVISSFARTMDCSRNTWHNVWQQYFIRYRNHPQTWYEQAKEKLEGV